MNQINETQIIINIIKFISNELDKGTQIKDISNKVSLKFPEYNNKDMMIKDFIDGYLKIREIPFPDSCHEINLLSEYGKQWLEYLEYNELLKDGWFLYSGEIK